MPIVRIENVGLVRFPDAMTDDEIVNAIETDILKFPSKQTAVSQPGESPLLASDAPSPLTQAFDVQGHKQARAKAFAQGQKVQTENLLAKVQSGEVTPAPIGEGQIQLPKVSVEDLKTLGVPELPAKIAAGVQQAIVGLPEGLVNDPWFAATLGLGGVAPEAALALASSFVTTMAAQAPKLVMESWNLYKQGDVEGSARMLTSAGLNAAFAATGAKQLARPMAEMAKVAPQTASALERTVKSNAESLRTGEGQLRSQGPPDEGSKTTGGNVVERTPQVEPKPVAERTETEVGIGDIKRGEIGGMLGSGEVVLTSSGRKTTPFPDVRTDTNRKATATLKRVDAWLKENALAEAEARGDDFNTLLFKNENPKNLPQASKDAMEEYLFGKQPPVQPNILKNKPAQQSTEQAPVSPAPAAAAVSEAKPPGAATPEVPPAIRETTTPVEVKQPAPVKTPPDLQAEARADLEAESAGTAGAITGTKLLPTGGPVIDKPVKGLHEIAADLAKGLDVPIRFGRLTTSKFAGYFKQVQNLIGSKKAVDTPVVSHEVGHKLDTRLKFSDDPALAAELDTLGGAGMSSWTKSKSRRYKMSEGMAEFVRYWLDDPVQAATLAPKTHAAFEKAMDANPDWGDVMRRAQSDIDTWRRAPNQARLRSHLSIGENPNGTPYRLRQLTRDLVDDLHFLRLVTDDAERFSGKKLPPSENIYMLARNLRGAYGRAEVFIRNGIVDFNTGKVNLGTSFEDALKPVSGHLDDFRDWIVAKQAKEMHAQGKETGLLQADIDAVVNRFDPVPEFHEAFNRVKAWNEGLLQYLEDAGFITKEGHDAMVKMNQEYVPFHRLFEIGAGETPSLESAGTGRGLNVGRPGSLKGRHGSVRPIVDPIETMLKNAYSLTVAAEKGYIHAQLAKLADRPGMGKWIEKIATPKEMERVGLDKIRKQLEDAGADLAKVPDDLLLTFYRNSERAPFGENIIRVVRDGKPEFYRLNSELFDTFHALDLDDAGKLVQILAAPANLLRSGVTLIPDFALANVMRDAFSGAIVSPHNSVPFEFLARGIAALIKRPELVAEWKAAGGQHAVEAFYFDRPKLQKFMREKITKELSPAEQALVFAKSPFVALRALSSFAEEATRIGEYKVAYDTYRKAGMGEKDAKTLATFESRDRQDFGKGGAKTKIIRRLAAFWNAGLQANVKLAQSFKERPVKTTLSGIAFITIPKLMEQWLNYDDQDYWDRPRWERDLFFLIPAGKDENDRTRFIRIPTPFEPGIIFGTFPGRLVELMREKDPSAFKEFFHTLFQQTIPNPIPNTLTAVFENFLSGKQGWDVFRGRTIVPDSIADLPVDMQWTEQTSLTARKLGKLLHFSPAKVDHIIATTTGGLGRQLVSNVADRIIEKATGEKRTARSVLPWARFVTTPAGMSSQAVEDFYENLSRILGEEQRLKQTGEGAPFASLAKDFRKAASAMSTLRQAARSETSEKEKQNLYLQIADIARGMNEVAKEQGVK